MLANTQLQFPLLPSFQVIFDIVMAVPLLGQFLAVLTILGILLYFVTSADSGCLIISHMTSNGSYDPPIIQRLFWTVTEGAVATALLYPGRFKEVRASDPLWAIGEGGWGTRRDFLIYKRNKSTNKIVTFAWSSNDMFHYMFKAEYVTLVSLKVLSGSLCVYILLPHLSYVVFIIKKTLFS